MSRSNRELDSIPMQQILQILSILTNEGFDTDPDHIVVRIEYKERNNSVEVPDANNFLFTDVGIGNIKLEKSSTMRASKANRKLFDAAWKFD